VTAGTILAMSIQQKASGGSTLREARASRMKQTADQLVALQNDLENIEHAANILPMPHSELFLNLLMHVRFTGAELAARRDALRG
jgi:hypothetical protein